MQDLEVPANTMKPEDGDKKSAKRILDGLQKAKDKGQPYQALCDEIDEVFSECFDTWSNSLIRDPEYDLFWSYTEVMKPAVYARSPIPVVAPMFNDRRPLYVTAAELLERAEISAFQRADIDEPMRCTRDDLIMYNRGVQWVVYVDDDGKKICVDHIDRKDFLHGPARKWSEVPWVARGVWLYQHEWEDRFPKVEWQDIPCKSDSKGDTHEGQARVWEVWHRADNKVYWVAEGYEDILEESDPHLDLKGFFPCPRPAYGTLRPNTLEPIPDYTRYVGHFRQVNSLTRRIYTLLDRIRMKGLLPAGGDLGTAIEALIADDSNATFLIPVDSAALMNNTSGNYIQWLPIAEIAEAVQGLMAARQEIFADFDRLSGISDIMRGETEAQETLGAQRLKSQYGSLRVRGKIDELVRVARDVTQIAAEIMAEEFDAKTLMEMSQMEIPTAADIKKAVRGLEQQAKDELAELMKQAEGMAQQAQQTGQQVEPAQAQQMLQQAQQEIIQKYAPQIKKLSEQVSIDDVMSLLKDNKARCFAFEIQTDSTVLTDEAQAKASANEFYAAFTGGMQGLVQAASMGPEVMRAASEVFKMVLGPYRPPRSVMAAIDDMLDAAPQIAQTMQAEQGEGDEMAGLAEAEKAKAEAQMAKVEADAAAKAADLQQRQLQMQIDTQEKQAKMMLENQKLEQKNAELALAAQKAQAEIDNIRADTMKKLSDAQVAVDSQALDQFKSLADIELKAAGMQQQAQQTQVDTALRVQDSQRSAAMGERQQRMAEQQAMSGANAKQER